MMQLQHFTLLLTMNPMWTKPEFNFLEITSTHLEELALLQLVRTLAMISLKDSILIGLDRGMVFLRSEFLLA